MVETAFIETQSKYWDYQANLLRVESDIDTDISTVDVTVYQDPDATGTVVNEDTVTLSGGYEELSISGFEEAEGGEYWMRVDFEYDEGISQEEAPSIIEATVSTDNVQEGYYETTSVNWDFDAQTVETVSTLDTDTAGIEITVQQQTDTGNEYEESVYPQGGTETHRLDDFVSATGQYNIYIDMAAVIDQSDQRVGSPSLDSTEIYPEGGIISGIVTDSVDSRVIGATIRAINVETGEMHVTETNSDGVYIFRGLEESEYHVTGEFGQEEQFNAVSKPFIDVFQPVTPDSGGTHQWNFDEGSGSTAADYIGNMDGSINGPSWVSGEGIGNSVLSFGGSGDIVDLGSRSRSELTHFTNQGEGTIAAWVNVNDLSTIGTVLGGQFAADQVNIAFCIDTAQTVVFRLDHGTGNNVFHMNAGSVPLNEWNFIAATMDGGTARVYSTDENGVVQEVGSTTFSGGTTSDWTQNARFGGSSYDQRYFNGRIGVPYINNIADSQSELQRWRDETSQYFL